MFSNLRAQALGCTSNMDKPLGTQLSILLIGTKSWSSLSIRRDRCVSWSRRQYIILIFSSFLSSMNAHPITLAIVPRWIYPKIRPYLICFGVVILSFSLCQRLFSMKFVVLCHIFMSCNFFIVKCRRFLSVSTKFSKPNC